MRSQALIAGIDEVGRGALAGAVVACAAVLRARLGLRARSQPVWSPAGHPSVTVADSKLLSPLQREVSYAWLTQHASYGIGVVEASVIDSIGIVRATEAAMHQALTQLRQMCEPTEILVDGRDRFHFPLPYRSIIRGDRTEPAIAAASILAKVTRDRMMVSRDHEYPGYGFAQHKGYGADSHRRAIVELGPCPIHRRTFLRSILPEPTLFTVE